MAEIFEAWLKGQGLTNGTIKVIKENEFTAKEQLEDLTPEDVKGFKLPKGQEICLNRTVDELKKLKKRQHIKVMAAGKGAKVKQDATAAGFLGGKLEDADVTSIAADDKAEIGGSALAAGFVEKDHVADFLKGTTEGAPKEPTSCESMQSGYESMQSGCESMQSGYEST